MGAGSASGQNDSISSKYGPDRAAFLMSRTAAPRFGIFNYFSAIPPLKIGIIPSDINMIDLDGKTFSGVICPRGGYRLRKSKTGSHIVVILCLVLWGTVWPGDGPSAHKARAEEGPTIWYVKANASGDKTGKDWENAFTTLQDALEAAEEGHEIWIAAGTYFPTGNQNGNDERTRHFRMKRNVAIYGGFAGNETQREERDIENNPTILSGDLGAKGNPEDNAYHVFYHDHLDLTGAILDGVTITGGNASDDATHGYGGGMSNWNSSPTLTNVAISGNSANSGLWYPDLNQRPIDLASLLVG